MLVMLWSLRLQGRYLRFGEFGKSSMICQTKPSILVLTINNLLADLLIHQIFFHQMLEKSQFAKLSRCQTLSLYGSYNYVIIVIMYLLMYFVFQLSVVV